MSSSHAESRFIPFARTDQYGLLGHAPQSLAERIRFFLFNVFVFPLKCSCGVLCLIGCHITCRMASLLPAAQCADVCAWTGKVWCRMALVSFGFNVRWVKAPGAGPGSKSGGAKPVGIICNHSR